MQKLDQNIIALMYDAGELAEMMQPKITPTQKEDGSRVTEADLAIHNLISERLGTLTPHVPIISEEDRATHDAAHLQSELCWVLDPIDGTESYIRNDDSYAILLALLENGNPTNGFMLFPKKDQGRLFFTYQTQTKAQTYVMSGRDQEPRPVQIPAERPSTERRIAVPWTQAARPSKVAGYSYDPVIGPAGEEICAVLEGRADAAFMSKGNSLWDIAAGHALIKGAGGDLLEVRSGFPLLYGTQDLDVLFHLPQSFAGHANVLRSLGISVSTPETPHNEVKETDLTYSPTPSP